MPKKSESDSKEKESSVKEAIPLSSLQFYRRVHSLDLFCKDTKETKCRAIIYAMFLGTTIQDAIRLVGGTDPEKWLKIVGEYLISTGVELESTDDTEAYLEGLSRAHLVIAQRKAAVIKGDGGLLKFLGGCVLKQGDSLDGAAIDGTDIIDAMLLECEEKI